MGNIKDLIPSIEVDEVLRGVYGNLTRMEGARKFEFKEPVRINTKVLKHDDLLDRPETAEFRGTVGEAYLLKHTSFLYNSWLVTQVDTKATNGNIAAIRIDRKHSELNEESAKTTIREALDGLLAVNFLLYGSERGKLYPSFRYNKINQYLGERDLESLLDHVHYRNSETQEGYPREGKDYGSHITWRPRTKEVLTECILQTLNSYGLKTD